MPIRLAATSAIIIYKAIYSAIHGAYTLLNVGTLYLQVVNNSYFLFKGRPPGHDVPMSGILLNFFLRLNLILFLRLCKNIVVISVERRPLLDIGLH